MHAQALGGDIADFDDHRFDQHLLAAHVQLADHLAQTALHIGRRGDHDGVGAFIACDHRLAAADAGAGHKSAGAQRSAGLRRGQGRAGSGLLVLAGGIRVAERALRRGRRGGLAGRADRLANKLLQHRHQQLGIGVVQKEHPHIATGCRRLIQFRHGARQLGQGCRIAAQHDAVAGINRRRLPASACTDSFAAALADLAEAGGDFARAGMFQGDHPHGRTVLIKLAGKCAHTGDIVGIIGDDHGVASTVCRHLAFAGHQRAQRFNGRGGVDISEADYRGFKAITALPCRRLRGGSVGRPDAERPARRWRHHQPIGAQGRQEQFEIAGLIERSFGNHRHLALYARIDDESATRGARDILNEGAHIGIAQIYRLLRQHGGQNGE